MLKKIIKRARNLINRKGLYDRYKKILSLNVKIKNTKTGKLCFIMGNGPSLKNIDLTSLRNEETFVVNTFWNHERYKDIDPKYYVLTDTKIFPQPGQVPETYNNWNRVVVEKSNVVNSCPKTKFFLDIGTKDFIESSKIYPKNEIFYLMLSGYFKDNHNFDIDISKPIPRTKNVILAALIIAVYMGFEEIYLMGCEHDYLAHPRLYAGFKHFYEQKPLDQDNKEEAAYYTLDVMPYEEHIVQSLILFKNYRLFKERLAKTNPNVKIYNATPNSFLDVFPNIKFDEIKL